MTNNWRLRHRVAIGFLGLLMLAGCGSVRYPTSYILNLPQPPAPRVPPPQELLGPVAIREFRCPDYLCGGRIVYRPTPEEVGFYEYHRWAMSPRQSITQFVADTLRARSLFTRVLIHEVGIDSAYVLSGNIERLEEVDEGDDVYAVCTISAHLLDARTRSILWSHTESEKVAVEKRSVAGVVSGLSAATRIAVDRLVMSLEKQLAPARKQ